MPDPIFDNSFNLTIRDTEIESDYRKLRDIRLIYMNLKIIIFSFVSCLATMIFQYYYYNQYEGVQFYKFNIIMCSTNSGLYLVFILLCIFYKKIIFVKWINYFVFYLQIFTIIAFRFTIFRIANASIILLFVQYLIETMVRLTWVVFMIHSFLECVILNLISLFTVWIVIPVLIPENLFKDEMVNTLNYSFVIFSVISIAYVLDRQKKEAFYFNWKNEKKAKKLTNILENLNSGFVSFKSGQITFINSYFKKILKQVSVKKNYKDKNEHEHEHEQEQEKNNKNEEFFGDLFIKETNLNLDINKSDMNININEFESFKFALQYIISKLKLDSSKNTTGSLQEFPLKLKNISFSQFLKNLFNYLSNIKEIENFQFIGDISFSTSISTSSCLSQEKMDQEHDNNFEVHCRINKSGKDPVIEFLFNDVSRIKFREKEMAELKYKSLILSKVSHEFKNPLICISEILNESFDALPREVQQDERIVFNFEQINSLSTYLQVLVKDLGYCSESQYGIIKELEKKEINLLSILEFCKKITNILLIKSNKHTKINFTMNIEDDVPKKIITDEWRLKQVLVNLLSNSVKFTIFGNISLDISLEKSNNYHQNQNINDIPMKIKISVKDTGVGIRESQFKNIIKPIKKSSTRTLKVFKEFRAELGLSIAKEISSKLGNGHGLEFESIHGEGSTFWFYLPLDSSQISKINLENQENLIKIDEEDIFINENLQNNSYSPICKRDIRLNIPTETNEQIYINRSINEESILTKQLSYVNLVKPLDLDLECSSSDDSVLHGENYDDKGQLKIEPHYIHKKDFPIHNQNHQEIIIINWENTPTERSTTGIRMDTRTGTGNGFSNSLLNTNNYNKPKFLSSKFQHKNKFERDYEKITTIKSFNSNKQLSSNHSPGTRLDNLCTNSSNNRYDSSKLLLNETINKTLSGLSSNNPEPDCINIIVTDDEIFTRQSTVRIVKDIGNSLKINFKILEAEDGIETLYLVYKAANIGIKISCIFSDECMNFMNGLRSSNIIKEILDKKGMRHIPFYLVTAYEGNLLDSYYKKDATRIFNKPLKKKEAREILEEFRNKNL